MTHQNPDLDSGDYLADLTLVGFLQLLGTDQVVEFPLRRAVHKTVQDFGLSDATKLKNTLYGKGCELDPDPLNLYLNVNIHWKEKKFIIETLLDVY